MEFENVIRNFNQYKNFSEYDEGEWDYVDYDDERTSRMDVLYDGESWDFPDDVREWGYGF